jgi:quinone-modifying oxidoreductase subunit QmoA
LFLYLLHGLAETGHLPPGSDPEAQATIFYIDIRTPGRYEQFYWKVRDDEGVHLIRGKVAKVEQEPGTDNVMVTFEHTLSGRREKMTFDLVVLAVGMVPSTKAKPFPLPLSYTPEGFVIPELLPDGIVAVGSLKSPLDVMKSNEDATGAALKSLVALSRR